FAGFDVEPAFARMRAPALIVHSLDDEQCPVSNAERIAALWPRNELALVDGLGHRLVAQDGAVLARIVDFIEGA
ncbi:MAG: alpha/beta fold hydrolase, partial [Hyphomonadaceae bacterium]